MADPETINAAADATSDIVKVGAGSGGLGALLAVFAGRFFGGQDKVLAAIEGVQKSITELGQKVAVMSDRLDRNAADVVALRASFQVELAALRLDMKEQDKRLDTLALELASLKRPQ